MSTAGQGRLQLACDRSIATIPTKISLDIGSPLRPFGLIFTS
jgi:hypothetical protein